MSIPVILLVVLALWLILGSLLKVAEVVLWIVVIGLLIGAGISGFRYLRNR
jgi:hypothetical protein